MFFKNIKFIKMILFSITFLFLLFVVYEKYYHRPKFKLDSVDMINHIMSFRVTDVKIGDVILLIKNSDENCNLGSVEAISVANNSTHSLKIKKRNNEYLYLFRIKVISGNKISCSPEIVINLFN